MTIRIRNLTHIYHSEHDAVVALSGLDLDLPTGSVTVVRGPNGSGKSTLVGIVAGLIKPSAGSITFDEQSISTTVIRQSGNVVSDLTVDEHVRVLSPGLQLQGELHDLKDTRAASLSTALRQQLAVHIATSQQPHLVLADEPVASLAHHEAMALYQLLADTCRSAGATLLLVTHDYRAETIADTVVRLRDGRVSETWTPGETERQAIDSRGWLRLPESARSRFDNSLEVRVGQTIELAGNKPSSTTHLNNQASETVSHGAFDDPHSGHLSTTPTHGGSLTPGKYAVELHEVCAHEGARPVTATVIPGSVTHISGPAGSGTSALLRVVTSMQSPAQGSVTVSLRGDHRTMAGADYRATKSALISAELSLGQHQRLSDFAPLPHVVAMLRLADLQHRPMSTLSGGQRQRALVAIALSQDVDVLAIDEPTVNLDPEWRHTCMKVIRQAALARGICIVLGTHDTDTIGDADHVIQLSPRTL